MTAARLAWHPNWQGPRRPSASQLPRSPFCYRLADQSPSGHLAPLDRPVAPVLPGIKPHQACTNAISTHEFHHWHAPRGGRQVPNNPTPPSPKECLQCPRRRYPPSDHRRQHAQPAIPSLHSRSRIDGLFEALSHRVESSLARHDNHPRTTIAIQPSFLLSADLPQKVRESGAVFTRTRMNGRVQFTITFQVSVLCISNRNHPFTEEQEVENHISLPSGPVLLTKAHPKHLPH